MIPELSLTVLYNPLKVDIFKFQLGLTMARPCDHGMFFGLNCSTPTRI
jgi:hypothetical protein